MLMDVHNKPVALVVGAAGGIGGEVAKALLSRGFQVRALARNPASAAARTRWIGPLEWVEGDAMVAVDYARAAVGASVVFHGANPPGYQNWRGLALPMLVNAVEAARASGARLIFPGNVYNFGPDAGPLLREESPQHPQTRKGQIRVEMERMLQEAAGRGVSSLIVRAGDFVGVHQPASWLRNIMITPGKPVKKVVYPGDFEVGHAWAYLPDLAQTIADLALREKEMPAFERFHFAGHWIARGVDFARALARAGGFPAAPVKSAPWALYLALSPFVTVLREMREMRYLWRMPVALDNSKLVRMLGVEPHTELDVALTTILSAWGCLSGQVDGFRLASEKV